MSHWFSMDILWIISPVTSPVDSKHRFDTSPCIDDKLYFNHSGGYVWFDRDNWASTNGYCCSNYLRRQIINSHPW